MCKKSKTSKELVKKWMIIQLATSRNPDAADLSKARGAILISCTKGEQGTNFTLTNLIRSKMMYNSKCQDVIIYRFTWFLDHCDDYLNVVLVILALTRLQWWHVNILTCWQDHNLIWWHVNMWMISNHWLPQCCTAHPATLGGTRSRPSPSRESLSCKGDDLCYQCYFPPIICWYGETNKTMI